MKPYALDLHIHSCLSPCADEDMTPANIAGMAHLKGLDFIAVSDHNSARNLPAAAEAAAQYGVCLLPALELTTAEEVHLLAYFRTVKAALSFSQEMRGHLGGIPNVPRIFGTQRVVDARDRLLEVEELLLIQALSLSLEELAAAIRQRGGVAVPAHINRGANGLLTQLGFVPEDSGFQVLEIARDLPLPPERVKGYTTLYASDAHSLGNILEREQYVHLGERSVDALFEYLQNPKNIPG